MNITRDTKNDKSAVLRYFRSRASEYMAEIDLIYGVDQYKEKAKKLNTKLSNARISLIDIVKSKSIIETWSKIEILENILLITYCNYVVMLESRHTIWNYEYMTFSRRIGELWEPFCKLPFEFSVDDIELFIPPLFVDVKKSLTNEIESYILGLTISDEEKNQLKIYYNKVWNLVTSGEIQLELDLHFIKNGVKYVVDFKSGFGSNEKGNTNRLLLVASIYQNMDDNYHPVILVRSSENNNYYTTLKNSSIWQAFSGEETYEQIFTHTGYDIKAWINNNITWIEDLDDDFVDFITEHNLSQYLIW